MRRPDKTTIGIALATTLGLGAPIACAAESVNIGVPT